jgi:hypothetical protein
MLQQSPPNVAGIVNGASSFMYPVRTFQSIGLMLAARTSTSTYSFAGTGFGAF